MVTMVKPDRARRSVIGSMRGREDALTIHARPPTNALPAWDNGGAPTQRRALATDIELDGRGFRTEMIEVPCRLGVQIVIAGSGPRFDDEDA